MPNIDTSIRWFESRKGKVTYSMANRNGPNSYDCSSSVYYALIAGKFLPKNIFIGNTDSLFGDLERNGWTKVPLDKNGNANVRRGDVFIWGKRGASAGAFGHTGMFVNTTDIIHCSYGYNGIHVDNHDWLWQLNGQPSYTFYRYTGKKSVANPKTATDQVLDVGSYIKFSQTYTVNDLRLVEGTWQVRTNTLCGEGFTWSDNGIPAGMVTEVDGHGYATTDQELAVNSKYIIPGKYRVLDLGLVNGMWLAQIAYGTLKLWVDVKTATEVSSSDKGTPVPNKKTVDTPPAKPPVDAEPVKPAEPVEESPPTPSNPDKPTNNPKEDTMAFTQKDQEKLKIATENAQEFATNVAGSETAEELMSSVSKRTKLFVYIVGDSLIGLAIIVPQIAVVAGFTDVVRIVAASGLLSAAGGFLLTMFGIYKSGTN